MSTLPELANRLAQWADQNGYSEKSEVLAIAAELRQQPQPVKPRTGTGALTRDLVWCECGRGLSATGIWAYCPRCGRLIDQEAYRAACDEANRLRGFEVEGDEFWREKIAKLEAPQPVNAELLEALRYLTSVSECWCRPMRDNCYRCMALKAIARAESVEKEPAPVHQQMLDALRFARVFIGEEEPIITKRLDDAIARAESAEKAPDALTLSHEIQAKRGFSMGADSTPAQPDVVSGLVDALVKIRDWSSNSLDLVTCAGGQWDLQVYQESIRALNTFEAQSKAEPKA